MKVKAGSVIAVNRMEGGLIKIEVKDQPDIIFDEKKASEANREYARFNGWKQRFVDSAALSKDTSNGAPASPREKWEAMKELVDFYHEGGEIWARTGTGEGQKSITVEAIAKVKGLTFEQAEAEVTAFAAKRYEGDTKKALAFLRTGERVMAAMDEIRKARMPAAKVDADQALAELGA